MICTFILLLAKFSGVAQTGNFMVEISAGAKELGEDNCLRSGDFNRDGYDDLVVICSLSRNNRKELTGNALIYRGTKTGLSQFPAVRIEGAFPGTVTGFISCTTGDFNSDGYDDLALGNNLYGEPQLDRGFIQIHYGSPEGIRKSPGVVVRGATGYGSFGSNLMTADFTGDGSEDLLVEARLDRLLEGRIYIYEGGRDFQLKSPAFSLTNPGSQSLYISNTGDVNRDGFADVVCRSNLNWNNHQHIISIFNGGPKADEKADRIIMTGVLNPTLMLTGKNKSTVWMVGSVNRADQTQVTQIASLKSDSFTLMPESVPGNARYTVLPESGGYRFFVIPPDPPIRLSLYELSDNGTDLHLISSFVLPGYNVSRLNGMVYTDSNGDGKRELAVAFTDGKKVKLTVIH